MWWVFPGAAQAQAASGLIALLGSQLLHNRAGVPRDPATGLARTRRASGAPSDATVPPIWSRPREAVDGAWAISDPAGYDLPGLGTVGALLDVRETPRNLVVSPAIDPDAVPWADLLPGLLGVPYVAGIETVERAAPAMTWVRGALAVHGLLYEQRDAVTWAEAEV